jgi:hypothetical protein
MSDPLQALLQSGVVSRFPVNSRYQRVGVAQLKLPGGKMVAYLLRRFVPPPENFTLLQEYVVTQDNRLDNIAALHLGDPEQFWSVCDANRAMRPEELTETIGRRLRITLPEGISGNPNV